MIVKVSEVTSGKLHLLMHKYLENYSFEVTAKRGCIQDILMTEIVIIKAGNNWILRVIFLWQGILLF